MKTIKYFLFIVFFVSFFSCNSKSEKEYFYLKPMEEISFILDKNTKSNILALFPYTDKSRKEYLTFQNQGQNEILFYDMNTHSLEFKLKPSYEGNNGVASFLGYYIHNLDSIYLTIVGLEELALINSDAVVNDKISYEKTWDDINLYSFYSASFQYRPIVIIDNLLYITPGCNRWVEPKPVCATIDMANGTVNAFKTFEYPTFPNADNKAKRAGIEEYYSRCFDGKQFVYSFHFEEDIHITSIDHKHVVKTKAKSKYIRKVKYPNDYGAVTYEDMCASPNYGNMLYDKYNDVYYRVAYPKTEIEKGIRGMELWYYGRKKFSIIIFDKDFNIIGETLFPDYTYNSLVMFIREDGLYISSSHYLNPEYSDDVLSFRRFDLVKK
jgi:hypothetical protein